MTKPKRNRAWRRCFEEALSRQRATNYRRIPRSFHNNHYQTR